MAHSWAENLSPSCTAMQRAGPWRVSARTVTAGTVMSFQFGFCLFLHGVSLLFRSVSRYRVMVLLGHVN